MLEVEHQLGLVYCNKITGRKFVTTFHGTYNFNNKIKKFYNSVMVRSNLLLQVQILFFHI